MPVPSGMLITGESTALVTLPLTAAAAAAAVVVEALLCIIPLLLTRLAPVESCACCLGRGGKVGGREVGGATAVRWLDEGIRRSLNDDTVVSKTHVSIDDFHIRVYILTVDF